MEFKKLEDTSFKRYYEDYNPAVILKSRIKFIDGSSYVIEETPYDELSVKLMTKSDFKERYKDHDLERLSEFVFMRYYKESTCTVVLVCERSRKTYSDKYPKGVLTQYVLEIPPVNPPKVALLTKEEIFKKYKIEI